jgi:uncharacterized protein YggE
MTTVLTVESKMDKQVVVAINSVGVAKAPNDRATFTLNIKSKSDSLELSKEQVEKRTVQVLKDLEDKNMSLDGKIETSVSNFKLEHREGGEKYPAGFQSVATVKWTVVIDDNLNDLYQACLKIDSTMNIPSFWVKDSEKLLEQAANDAADKVKIKLNKECELLGVSISKLKILSWNFGYGSYATNNVSAYVGIQGATGPQGSQGSPGVTGAFLNSQPVFTKLGSIYQELIDTKLEPGIVSLSVSAHVNYIWNE